MKFVFIIEGEYISKLSACRQVVVSVSNANLVWLILTCYAAAVDC